MRIYAVPVFLTYDVESVVGVGARKFIIVALA